MTTLDYVIGGVGTSLQALILARGLFARMYKHYPFFYAALTYSFLESLFVIHLVVHKPAYSQAAAIWIRSISPLVSFLTAWEVYRQVFSGFFHFRERVAKILSPVLLVVVGASFAADFAGRPLLSLTVLAIEWQCRLAQATILAFTLVGAKFYSIPLGRNVLGMAYGLGLFVSLAVSNLALRGQFGSAHRYVNYIYTLSSLATYGIWCWSLWHFAPNAAVSPLGETTVSRGALSVAWARTFEALKKGFGR